MCGVGRCSLRSTRSQQSWHGKMPIKPIPERIRTQGIRMKGGSTEVETKIRASLASHTASSETCSGRLNLEELCSVRIPEMSGRDPGNGKDIRSPKNCGVRVAWSSFFAGPIRHLYKEKLGYFSFYHASPPLPLPQTPCPSQSSLQSE